MSGKQRAVAAAFEGAAGRSRASRACGGEIPGVGKGLSLVWSGRLPPLTLLTDPAAEQMPNQHTYRVQLYNNYG